MLALVQPVYAADHTAELRDYPNARVALSLDENRQNHPIITNRMKRVNGVVTSDNAKWFDGHLIRNLYLLPPGHSSTQGYEFYVKHLRDQGVDPLFECRSFSCGASNFWANDIFGISTLYGQDKEQAFYIGKKQHTFYTVYAVRRGNGRIYTLVDVFKPHGYGVESVIEQRSADRILRLASDHSGIEKSSDLTAFVANMNSDSSMNALLIIHSTVPDTLSELDTWQVKMVALQGTIAQYLKEQGISESRLRFNISIGTHESSLKSREKPSFWLEVIPLN
ncbi:DUF4892 domain-containing protein [Endozoicomonas sp. SCSIO W0465]|uniref:DUF4892 domain-containing protein n=1 Tax=Endozoicomonas sp. SCSIO W0465 TaxID=2918516 RepID=UPI002075476A|nr:DUF4892 domain-containing protein [Endozoicomonas sp. SCSIO W0465]USE39178.1 DUF4892 domain-containing protein [Endozoicomonas sp. SCSIO W0465]